MNVALVNSDKPLASVLLFAVEDNFNFYFAVHPNSYKSKAINNNKKISFSVWSHFDMLLQADGEIESVDDVDRSWVISQLAIASSRIKNFWPPILSLTDNNYRVLKITPNWLRVLDLKNLKINEDGDPFQTIKVN